MSFIKDLIVWKARADRDGPGSGETFGEDHVGTLPNGTEEAAFDEDAFDEALFPDALAEPPDVGSDGLSEETDTDGTDLHADWISDRDDTAWDEPGILDEAPAPRPPVVAPGETAKTAVRVAGPQIAVPLAATGPVSGDGSKPSPGSGAEAAAGAAGTPDSETPRGRATAQSAVHVGGEVRRTDGSDIEAILSRVAARNAARSGRAAVRSEMRSVAGAAPPKIWELNVGPAQNAVRRQPPSDQPAAPLVAEPTAAAARSAQVEAQPQAAAPAQPQPRPQAGRVKTRLLGFHQAVSVAPDPFDAPAAAAAGPVSFPTGWVVVVGGPGRGSCFTLQSGVSQIGRGEDQAIRLDFGDMAISRQNHAAIAYDDEMGRFYLGHGGKLNLVRLNDRPVLSTEELTSDDLIRIGETTLKFVAFCGAGFCWNEAATPAGRGSDAAAG
jgi:hypothetical protein